MYPRRWQALVRNMTGGVWYISPKRDCLLLHRINSQRPPHKVCESILEYFCRRCWGTSLIFQILVSDCGFLLCLPFFNEGKVKFSILMIHRIILDFWNNPNFLGWFFKNPSPYIFLPFKVSSNSRCFIFNPGKTWALQCLLIIMCWA